MAKSLAACPGCGMSVAPATLAAARTLRNGSDYRGAWIPSAETAVLPGRHASAFNRSSLWLGPGNTAVPRKTSNIHRQRGRTKEGPTIEGDPDRRLELTSLASLRPGIDGLGGQDKAPLPVTKSWKSQPRRLRGTVVCAAGNGVGGDASARLVTFLGKGGSGKTTAAVLLAKAYAAEGKRTALVVQGQDRVAESLLGRKLPTAPEPESPGSALSVVRLESTKLLLEPLAQLKKLDARLGFSSGALQEVVGEELSILPSMDTLLAAGALERLTNVTGILNRQPTGTTWDAAGKYDVVVYDGPSNQDVLRLFGAAERARWYLSRFRRLAEKTDAGRVLLPSAARAVDSVLNGGSSGGGEGTSTAAVWGTTEKVLDGAAQYFTNSDKFTAFLVSKQGSKTDLATALRLWGCASQAGLFVGGLLFSPGGAAAATPPEGFSPLESLNLPAAEESVGEVSGLGGDLAGIVRAAASSSPAPRIDAQAGTVALFLPGFEKTEIKLSQYQKGAELLVEAGDQRRSISVPPGMRGKVSGAKFSKGFLTVTLKPEVAKV